MYPTPLEEALRYCFQDRKRLEEAKRHRSFVNEHPGSGVRNNERLEFLGDAVINLAVGHLLMERFSDAPEGELSKMRSILVNEFTLADIARSIKLGSYLFLGKGEDMSGGREKNSILADALEALYGAIYLDGGYKAAYDSIMRFTPFFLNRLNHGETRFDYKSRLQEHIQGAQMETPTYRVAKETGPDHDKTFEVEIAVAGILAKGTGKSKKAAEQEAAKSALEMIRPAGY